MKKFALKVQTPKETAEQATVIDWARGYGSKLDGIDMLFSIPNGAFFASANRFAIAAKLKNEGLRPGVSDLFLSVARHGHHGLYIEMKRRKGGVESGEQESFRIRAQEEGYKVAVCRTASEAIKLIQEYLAI